MKKAPAAMPTDHTMPMAESSRMRPRSDTHSMPSAEATANAVAPSEPVGQAQTAERGVGDAARQEHHAPAHHIGADDTARDPRKDAGRQRVTQVGIL